MIRAFAAIMCFMLAWPLLAEEKEGGIIGTGVIGQITALDQFEVSGMRFELAPDVELQGIRTVADLQVGMTLAASTGRDGAAWQIKSLRHMPLLSGPITAPGEVMGVRVKGELPITGSVQVDGFWSETGIVASRIVSYAEETVQVSGLYDGRGLVGQVPVQGADLSSFTTGETLSVTGQFENGAIMIETVTEGAFPGPSPDLVLLEGFFQPTTANDVLTLQGIAVASVALEDDLRLGALVRRCALDGRADFSRDELTPRLQETVSSFCVSASN